MSTKNANNYRGINCLNCKHPLDISDKFCPNCGQRNSTKRLMIRDFIDEFLANFYAYDSRVKHTIVSLFKKPGVAARDFIQGKRLYYANPFRFYLSISLIYFIFSGIVSNFNDEAKTDLESNLISTKETSQKGSIISFNKKDKTPSNRKQPLEEELLEDNSKDTLYTEKQIKDKSFFKRTSLKIRTYINFVEKSKEINPDKILDILKHDKTKWNKYLLRKSYQINNIMSENKSQEKKYLDYLEGKIPFILFVSLPFLTIFFAVVYYRKKLFYAEHMVFVFSIMSFVFLIIFITDIIQLITNIDLSILMSLVITYYFYKSLRNFYEQSRLKTILKFVILSILLPITASFVALFVMFVGFLLY